jgi:hypothetical protein
MNFPHIHMMITHIPIIAIPVAMVFFIHSILRNVDSTRRFALIILVLTSVLVLPTKFSGEEAEEAIEHMPGVSKHLIHEHEEAADISVILTLLAGGAALVALLTSKKTAYVKYANWAVLGLSTAAVASLMYTANQGGKVRHPEISDSDAQAIEAPQSSGDSGDND